MSRNIKRRRAGAVLIAIGVVAFAAISIVWVGERRNPDPTTQDVISMLEAKPQHSGSGRERMASERPESDKRSSTSMLSREQGAAEADVEDRNEPSEHSVEQEAEARAKEMAVLRLIYEDVASVAGLSNPEKESLMELLFEQQTELYGSNVVDPVSSLDEAEAHNQMLARHRAEVAALVGTSKASAVIDYQKSIDARFQVEDLRRQLESAGMPISEEQRRGLIRAAIERGAYVPRPEFTGASSEEAMAQELFARVQQRDQKMLQLARSLLRTSQVIWYEELLQQRHNALEESLRASYNDPR